MHAHDCGTLHHMLRAGATGLVGCRLVSKLASQGHTVRALTRSVNSARSKLPFPGVEVYGPADWAKAIQVCCGRLVWTC